MSEETESSEPAFWGNADDAEALQRYRTLLNAIDDGVFRLDARDRFVAVNDALVELTGHAREALLGERVSVLFGDDGSTIESELERLRASPAERSERLTVTVRTAGGGRARCELRVNLLEADDTSRETVGVVRDLTERKGTERGGDDRERELERYERIVENLPVGVYRNTPGRDGEFVTGNSTLASIFDAGSMDELLEYNVSDLYTDPGQRAEFSRQLERSGVVEGLELEQETLDGDRIWISVTAIRTEEDGEVYFDGIVQDITDRRKRAQELEARSAAIEETVDGIAILDESEEYSFVNPAHADIYGYEDPSAFLGETWRMCYDDEEIERIESEVMPTLFEEGSWRGEATGVRRDGSTFPQELSLTVLDDGRYVCVVRDVTERREHERDLKRAEILFTESRDVNAVLDRNGTFQYVTPSATRVLGYEPQELVGENAFDYVHPEDRKRVTGAYAELVENPEREPSVEYRFEHADGSWIVLESRGRNLLDEPNIEGIVVYSRDVTERRERERKLEETVERLEKSNRRLESFASMLAHELRNPVAIGQIYSQRLTADSDPDSEAIDHVTEAFDRIEEMIDVMLVLTRGREAVGERNPISIADTARDAWEEVDAPDATLTVEIDDELRADETYVRHLFRNLFENAVEHGRADAAVRVGRLPSGFYVADDGGGIPTDDRDVVFEAGYTTAADEDGTGLGLAFVRELADVYEWTCAVSESATGGARIEVRGVDFVSEE